MLDFAKASFEYLQAKRERHQCHSRYLYARNAYLKSSGLTFHEALDTEDFHDITDLHYSQYLKARRAECNAKRRLEARFKNLPANYAQIIEQVGG